MEKSMISESVAAASPPPRPPLLISPPPAALRCCCGSVDCALLKQNCEVLETVEKDVHTAARLGQALLVRHEAYMASAERDRSELSAKIEELEAAKKDLEAENARTIEENRHLLDQLEVLNGTVMDSDTRIRTLEATLQSSQQAVRRLEGAAVRAAEMERQISVLEQEQAELQNTLILSESEARTAMSRWKRAERGIVEMQQQLEKMEREANEERHRHAEVLGRMERQREVEKELSTAAARLKGAAAAKSVQGERGGTGVVNHFVRDLLQDNANLQLGMAELREMLLNSNDEIQALREQLMYHQPDDDLGPSTPTLRAELGSNSTTKVSQEVHVHHHYHYAPPKAETKKAKKKRQVSASGIFTPPGLSMSPTQPLSAIPWRLNASPSPPALSSHSAKPSASTTAMTPNRWSVFSEQPSEFAPSSVPSSPVSNHRFSVFDPTATVADQGLASPTTTAEPSSPIWRTPHRRHVSEASMCSLSGSLPVVGPQIAPSAIPHASSSPAITIREEAGPEQAYQHYDEEDEPPELPTAADDTATTTEESSFSPDEELLQRPRLHRAVSHESIMSLAGGLDIHTLKARPSQLTLRPIGLGGAEATLSGIVARPVLSGSGDRRGSVVLRDNLAAMPRMVSSPLSSSSGPQAQGGSGLGRWAAWRPWGGPRVSLAAVRAGAGNSHPNSPKQAAPPPPPQPDTDKLRDLLRAPGINQPGAIPGFQQYWAATKRRGAPSKVSPDVVDRDALREILEG